MKITVDIDSGAAQGALRGLQRAATHLAPAFRSIGTGIADDARLRFKDSRDPYGQAWLPLAKRTIAQRRKGKGSGGAKPLLDTGRLRNSIAWRLMGPHEVHIGTNVAYGAIHQFGGTIHYAPRSILVRLRKTQDGRSVFAKSRHKKARAVWGTSASGWTVRIPARPFLATQRRGLPREYGEIIRDALATHFARVEVRP